MDWFKGNFTGKPFFFNGKIDGFRFRFSQQNQSIIASLPSKPRRTAPGAGPAEGRTSHRSGVGARQSAAGLSGGQKDGHGGPFFTVTIRDVKQWKQERKITSEQVLCRYYVGTIPPFFQELFRKGTSSNHWTFRYLYSDDYGNYSDLPSEITNHLLVAEIIVKPHFECDASQFLHG